MLRGCDLCVEIAKTVGIAATVIGTDGEVSFGAIFTALLSRPIGRGNPAHSGVAPYKKGAKFKK